MFNFSNIDEIDNGNVAPEWQKWQEGGDWQKAVKEEHAVLEDQREEQYAAADDEEDYVYEKLEIPFLPEECFDPMGLADDTIEAVEESMASLNGQVLVTYIAGAFEDHLQREYELEQKKQYIESLHSERLAVLEQSGFKAKADAADKSKQFDRKKFSWREIQTPLVGQVHGMPEGGAYMETAIYGERCMKACQKLANIPVLPCSAILQIICTIANQTRPMPQGRMGRNAAWHIQLTDLFFPAAFVLEDGRDYLEHRREAPYLMVAMGVSSTKEAGEIEAKSLLEGVKLASPASFGFKKPQPLGAITE